MSPVQQQQMKKKLSPDATTLDQWELFPDMTKIVPEGSVGWARVEHFDCEYCFVRDRGGPPPPGRRCAKLIVYDELVMTDSADERYSNQEVVRNAHGRVLIGGLGLGMILHPIAAKPQVTSVTVLEASRDVIELVGPTVPSKVRLECADVFE